MKKMRDDVLQFAFDLYHLPNVLCSILFHVYHASFESICHPQIE